MQPHQPLRQYATTVLYNGAAGYQSDSATGLHLLGHRYYDPSIGRFLSSDPAQAGTNWYAYCDNNPLGRADASGLEWGWIVWILHFFKRTPPPPPEPPMTLPPGTTGFTPAPGVGVPMPNPDGPLTYHLGPWYTHENGGTYRPLPDGSWTRSPLPQPGEDDYIPPTSEDDDAGGGAGAATGAITTIGTGVLVGGDAVTRTIIWRNTLKAYMNPNGNWPTRGGF